MAMELNQQIDTTDPEHITMLGRLQANIIKHHGRPYAWHIFLRFNAAAQQGLRNWLHGYACLLTSAARQLQDAAFRRINPGYDGGMVRCFFLAPGGFQKLGLTVLPQDAAFREGMAVRGPRELADPPAAEWQESFMHSDAMILLADTSLANLQQAFEKILAEKELFNEVFLQKGEVLRNEHGSGIEHFGYADGVSQPSFVKGEVAPGKKWDDNCLLSSLLVEEKVEGHTNCYGSYLVFRKLEQHVKAFKKKEEKLGEVLFPNAEHEEREIAGAYIVGRFESGSPVVKHAQEEEIDNDDELDNDFDYSYDPDASKCPFHAHIRLTNPRSGIAGRPVRIARRGMPYDEAGRNGNLNWLPTQDVGLLFMCYQSSIVNQFEVIQRDLANNGTVAGKKYGIDGVIGQGANEEKQCWPKVWDDATAGCHQFNELFKGFVTMKGGDYFYAPSLPFLQNV